MSSRRCGTEDGTVWNGKYYDIATGNELELESENCDNWYTWLSAASGSPDAKWYDWLPKALGWVIAALAFSLGAPFWYDLLQRSKSIKKQGSQKKETA